MPRSVPLCLSLACVVLGIAPAQAQDVAPPVAQVATSDVPHVDALRTPDGSYTLTVYPPFAWLGAEVEVKGTDGVDLGPADAGQVVRVVGWSGRKGPLDITIRVATQQRVGVTWEFLVDPTSVPETPPTLKRAEPKSKRRGHR